MYCRNKLNEFLFRPLKLNMNPCSKEEFSCNDGSCFPLTYRCDGASNCKPQGEDEIGCHFLQLNDSYNQEIPPGGNDSIVLSMSILDIQDVNLLDGVLKTHLKLDLLWSDFRWVLGKEACF